VWPEWLLALWAALAPPQPAPVLPIDQAVGILNQGCGRHGADVNGPCRHPEYRPRNVVVFEAP
jgi:hypothetical protein